MKQCVLYVALHSLHLLIGSQPILIFQTLLCKHMCLQMWGWLGLLTPMVLNATLTNFLSSPLMFLLHAAVPLFLSSSRDIPGLINCHPPLLSAIKKAGEQFPLPPVSCLILLRLLQLVKFKFYAISCRFYPQRLTISGDSKISQHQ